VGLAFPGTNELPERQERRSLVKNAKPKKWKCKLKTYSLQTNGGTSQSNETAFAMRGVGGFDEITLQQSNDFVDRFDILGRISLADTLFHFETSFLAFLIVPGNM
jgi:hypothetical protein